MNRLWIRLSLAFLLVAWLAIGVVALIVQGTTETSFRHYVNQSNGTLDNDVLIERLLEHFATTGSWIGVEALLPNRGADGSGNGSGSGSGRGYNQGGMQVLVADSTGLVVAATAPDLVGTTLDENTINRAVPLVVAGEQVGWLSQETPGEQALGETETRFLSEVTVWLTVAALGATVLAVIVGVTLAWSLTRPLRVLTNTANELATGELGRQVTLQGTNEVIELAQAFNHMSRDLADGEALRRRMAADIAHELRTPVSVLRGHLEAMLDGVFPLDGERLAVAYDKAIHLARLVDDLRLLTLAEAGQLPLTLTTIEPGDLTASIIESFTPLALDAQITLSQNIAPELPSIRGDTDRLHQVLGNLLVNALRHTAPGGQIAVHVTQQNDMVRFAVTNSGTGLTPEQAAHVFERFWRADDARKRDEGGSGLGLAITQQLVTLHQGRIWVESAPQQTTFFVELPADDSPPF